MTTRSIAAADLKAIETVSKSFPFTYAVTHEPFIVEVPEGGILLSGWDRLMVDGSESLPLSGAPTPDGRGWKVQVPVAWGEYEGRPGKWKAEATITITYALPA
ncbi:hypothetical protein ACWD4B_13760 [Streptomyces sp. NPDC002536]